MKTYLFRSVFTLLLLNQLMPVSGQVASWTKDACWIAPGYREDTMMRPCPVFQKIFRAEKSIRHATLLITALGLYEASINHQRVGKAYFTPGWTSYDKRILYQQYDVTKLLDKGENYLSVTIGEGWYRGALGGFMERDNYGKTAGLLYQLDVVYADGTRQTVVSDSSWTVSTGPILHADIYGGELYDAGKETGPSQGVVVIPATAAALLPGTNEPVEKHPPLLPVRLITTPRGEQVADFGQNLSGWVQLSVRGKKGDTITIRHAELLDREGNFYTGNLRDAAATDRYILKGGGQEVFEPHFTWHGFRYVKVDGCPIRQIGLKAIPLYSALKVTGSFSCSNPLLNRLQQNIEWSMKGNFLDIPTDCPQRSERLGWTGDAQVFFNTAAFNMDVRKFFEKWLADLSADQWPDGAVPNIIPNLYRKLGPRKGVAGWGDAATIIPFGLYQVYGDSSILRKQYASMKGWVDYITSVSPGYLWKANGYGDWYAPGDSTSLPYINQCFWAHSTELLMKAARVLGKADDENKYQLLLTRIREAFVKNYFDGDGKAVTHTQTAYVLALEFDMLPDRLKVEAVENLVNLVKSNDNHLATGFLGTPSLLFALSKNGYTGLAYKILQQESYPSWLYAVKHGATTIWEKWDAIKPDGTIQAASFNHYSYGAVGDWLYKVVAGIDMAAPGYKKIIIRHQPGGGLQWVKASYLSPAGKIVSNWKLVNGILHMEVEIPKGCLASIFVPGEEMYEVSSGKYRFKTVAPEME